MNRSPSLTSLFFGLRGSPVSIAEGGNVDGGDKAVGGREQEKGGNDFLVVFPGLLRLGGCHRANRRRRTFRGRGRGIVLRDDHHGGAPGEQSDEEDISSRRRSSTTVQRGSSGRWTIPTMTTTTNEVDNVHQRDIRDRIEAMIELERRGRYQRVDYLSELDEWHQHRRQRTAPTRGGGGRSNKNTSASSSSSSVPSATADALEDARHFVTWRKQMVEWSYDAVNVLRFHRDVVEIAFTYLDRYLAACITAASLSDKRGFQPALVMRSKGKSNTTEGQGVEGVDTVYFDGSREMFQLASMTCLYLACKIHDMYDKGMDESQQQHDIVAAAVEPSDASATTGLKEEDLNDDKSYAGRRLPNRDGHHRHHGGGRHAEWGMSVNSLSTMSRDNFHPSDFCAMEVDILTRLDFRLNPPTVMSHVSSVLDYCLATLSSSAMCEDNRKDETERRSGASSWLLQPFRRDKKKEGGGTDQASITRRRTFLDLVTIPRGFDSREMTRVRRRHRVLLDRCRRYSEIVVGDYSLSAQDASVVAVASLLIAMNASEEEGSGPSIMNKDPKDDQCRGKLQGTSINKSDPASSVSASSSLYSEITTAVMDTMDNYHIVTALAALGLRPDSSAVMICGQRIQELLRS